MIFFKIIEVILIVLPIVSYSEAKTKAEDPEIPYIQDVSFSYQAQMVDVNRKLVDSVRVNKNPA